MVKEFNKQGQFIDGGGYFTPYPILKRKEHSPLRILDGSDDASIVQKTNESNNIALSKMNFAKYVVEKHTNYDFDLSVFTPIVEIIREIINSVPTV